MSAPRSVFIPGLGRLPADSGLIPRQTGGGGQFRVGAGGVASIHATGDGKVEFIAFHSAGEGPDTGHTLAYVGSSLGYPAFYPVHEVRLERPVQAVLMDLDGTSVTAKASGRGSSSRQPPTCSAIPASPSNRRTCLMSPATACRSTCSTA